MAGQRLVALIRGINVGRAKRVAMAELRAMIEDLGYRDCRTLLNSGNVVFTGGREAPGKTAGRLQAAMAAKLGVDARFVVLTADDLATVVRENPLAKVAKDPARFLVAFVQEPAALAALAPVAKQDWKPEALAVGTRAAYLWCASGIADGKLVLAAGKALGIAGTTRNWTTVLKIQALL
jgi:uncharacterized protein (DUF1697 family)